MNVPLDVSIADLRRRAEQHAQAIDKIKAARADNERMNSEASTLGPLYHEVRASIGEVTARRDEALAAEERRHEEMRDALLQSAAEYERVDAENRAKLTFNPADR
ncbi:type VII secretion target [Mycolicibacterium conceptionense]|uniref:type VII secretion target n=1 Tax=Mycolicibacterium conceptionense TaxID=451644 RepID=UPI003204A6E8